MAIEKMKLVSFSGKVNKLDKIISKCLLDGNFHPENASEYVGLAELLDLMKGSEAVSHIDEIVEHSSSKDGTFDSTQAVQYMSSSLGYNTSSGENPYLPVIQSIKELSNELGYTIDENENEIDDLTIDEDVDEYLKHIGEEVKKLNDERKSLLEQKTQCENAIKQYSHFVGLEIPLEDVFNGEFFTIRFGQMPKDSLLKLQMGYSENPYVLYIPCTEDEKQSYGVYLAPNNKKNEVDKIFAALHFQRLVMPEAVGSIRQVIENLNTNQGLINSAVKDCEAKVARLFEEEKEKIISIYNQYKARNIVFEMRKYAFILGNNFLYVGWIPQKKSKSIYNKLTSFKGIEAHLINPEDIPDREPPVKLKNSGLFSPFEYFVNMYGLPKYKDIDITFFVAVVYTFVFGVMFSDLGQGLVLAAGAFILWKKKKTELAKIMIPCGIASAISGCVFGSVFGFEEALNPVYRRLGMDGKPLDVMESVNGILVFAIFTGVFLVFCAMLLHILISLKQKKIGEALFSENGLAGAVLYFAGVCAVYSFMGGKKIIPTRLVAVLFILCLLILFMKEILIGLVDEKKLRKPQSLVDFILQNIFECLEYVLSYFSNTLSFLRVGAFVIVHASMMKVVFTLAGDTSTVKGIIVVILGNIVVIGLEALLTGIQGLRLVFYEMFSRFHEGGGKPFQSIHYKKINRRIKK